MNSRFAESAARRRTGTYRDAPLDRGTEKRLLVRAAKAEVRGDLEECMAIYDEITDNDDLAALALQRKAQVLLRLGKRREASATLKRALHHCVQDPERSQSVYRQLGDLNRQLHDYEEACYYYRRALVLAPWSTEIRSRLHEALDLARGVPSEIA